MTEKQRGIDKISRAVKIPLQVIHEAPKKPEWLKVKLPSQPEKVGKLLTIPIAIREIQILI